jgi:hypothetical protein
MPVPIPGLERTLKAQVARVTTIGLIDAIRLVTEQANARTARTLLAFCESIQAGVDGSGPRLAQAHAEIAGLMQAAILDRYNEERQGTPPYRADEDSERYRRYAGQKLAAILAAPDFVVGTEKGITVGDIDTLDEEAKQWYRLNFGAGAAAGGPAPDVSMKFSNLSSFVLQLDRPASKAFSIPAGYWIGGDSFYPDRVLPQGFNPRTAVRQQRRPTRGIRGEHFIEAGFTPLAENIGPAYTRVMQDIFQAAKRAGTTNGLQRVGQIRVKIT